MHDIEQPHEGGDEIDISGFQPFDFTEETIPDSAFCICIGSRRSGKSFTTNWILQRMQKSERAFTHIFLFSPTDSGFEGIPKKFRFKDISSLEHIMNQQKRIKKHNQKMKKKEDMVASRVCIIMDDCACMSGNESLRNSKALEWCALNGRHMGNDGMDGNGVSIFVLSQSLTRISRAIRLNCDLFIFNALSSSVEAEMVLAECFFVCNTRRDAKRSARDVYETLVKSKDYRFIAVLNHISNKRTLTDYIQTVDAEKIKDFQFFGTMSDDEGSDDEEMVMPDANEAPESTLSKKITVNRIDANVSTTKGASGGRQFFSSGNGKKTKYIPY